MFQGNETMVNNKGGFESLLSFRVYNLSGNAITLGIRTTLPTDEARPFHVDWCLE